MTSHARKRGLESPFHIRPKPAEKARVCDHPGCAGEGEFRTARSPREMSSHIWLCTDHIREHNKAWNFFEGMSDAEVEATVRHDTVWQRPTWKLGANPSRKAKRGFAGARFHDAFGLFDDDGDHAEATQHKPCPPGSPQARAYAAMDLNTTATLEEVKARYKQLVKRHHPDANNGAKEAEEKFKEIAVAYQVIVKHLEG